MPSTFSSSSSSITSSSPSSTAPCLMDRHCIEELHFDVPLISTRRVSTANKSAHSDQNANQAYSPDTSRSVPFLWERAPGVPKDSTPRNAEEEVFTPRPPPGRWRPPSYLNESTNDGVNYSTSDASVDTDRFSDALEKISLSESLGIPCRLSVSRDTGPGVTRAPSFIMNRFLPAANALAASSAASASPKCSNYWRSREPTELGRGRRLSVAEAARKIGSAGQHCADHARPAASPTRACGIMLLFPWSMKRAVCGLERPVRCQTRRMTSLDDFTAHRSKKSATNGSGMGSDDALSHKAWKSPGWGLPFLDTSRVLWRREKSNKGFMAAERECPRRRDGCRGVAPEIGRPLPVLKTPSEPWLANALNSVNRRRRH